MFWVHRYDLIFIGMIIFSMCRKKQPSLGFLKRCKKYFTPSDLRTIYVTYIRPKMEYNSHLWTGASKSAIHCVDRIQSRAWKLIGDDRVASCKVLFFKYYFGKYSSGLSELILPPQVFARNSRLSERSHAFTVATMSYCTTH